jgi:hypothetical protein
MNSKKAGKLFIVLMVSLIAFGFGSLANVLNSGNDITFGTLPSISASNNDQQISTIGDPSFEPAHVMRQFYNNSTNTTNSTSINNTINSTVTNSSRSSRNSTR